MGGREGAKLGVVFKGRVKKDERKWYSSRWSSIVVFRNVKCFPIRKEVVSSPSPVCTNFLFISRLRSKSPSPSSDLFLSQNVSFAHSTSRWIRKTTPCLDNTVWPRFLFHHEPRDEIVHIVFFFLLRIQIPVTSCAFVLPFLKSAMTHKFCFTTLAFSQAFAQWIHVTPGIKTTFLYAASMVASVLMQKIYLLWRLSENLVKYVHLDSLLG